MKVRIKQRFKDINIPEKIYEIGQEVEFSDEARIKDIVARGLVEIIEPKNTAVAMGEKVFVVHGRDRSMRETVSEYIKSLGLEPVILFKQTNQGKTIIEKIERCADQCSYAIVLLSPDDYGGLKGEKRSRPRARQNVILELGYMWGKLGREKVAILYKGDVKGDLEKPTDADGIVHIPYILRSGWREQLKKELEGAGLLDKLITVRSEPKPQINAPLQSLMDKNQVEFKIKEGFLTPTVTALFPSRTGKKQAIHVSADQIKGTRDTFIVSQNEFYKKAIPWLYAHGSTNGDVILGMIWDFWQNEKAKYVSQ